MTKTEKIVWSFLKQRPLGFKFRKQHPWSLFVLDFYCHRAGLVIEVDGDYHVSPNQLRMDRRRDAELTDHNLSVLRLSDKDVLYDFTSCQAKIVSLLCPLTP